MEQHQTAERFLRPEQVFDKIGFRDSWVRAQEKAGRFPKSLLIGTGKVKRRVWRESEVTAWMQEYAQERDQLPQAA